MAGGLSPMPSSTELVNAESAVSGESDRLNPEKDGGVVEFCSVEGESTCEEEAESSRMEEDSCCKNRAQNITNNKVFLRHFIKDFICNAGLSLNSVPTPGRQRNRHERQIHYQQREINVP